MHRVLSGSHMRKATALLMAVVAFVLLYETRMLDSQSAAWQAVFGGKDEKASPKPGVPLKFSATAYCKGTTTASGVRVRTGVAAADPALLPVGSVVNIAVGDAKYSGVYTVMDTGPEVQGRELDLYIWSCNEALRFGRRAVQVTVLRLGWDPLASSPTLISSLFSRREAATRQTRPAPPRDNRPPVAATTSLADAATTAATGVAAYDDQ